MKLISQSDPRYNDTPLCERSWGNDEPEAEMCGKCGVTDCKDRVK